jgi:hypothetical protein
MPPGPVTVDKHCFAALPLDLPEFYGRAIREARDRAGAMLDAASAFRAQVVANPDVSTTGAFKLLRERFERTLADAGTGYGPVLRGAAVENNQADAEVQGALWADVDDRESVGRVQDRLLALTLATRRPLPRDARNGDRGEVAVDGDGNALLATGTDAHRLLDRILTRGPLAQARLTALAVQRADPVLLEVIGGEPVKAAALAVVTRRAAQESPAVAAAIARRAEAHRATEIARGDAGTIRSALRRALGLPPEIAQNARKAADAKKAADARQPS